MKTHVRYLVAVGETEDGRVISTAMDTAKVSREVLELLLDQAKGEELGEPLFRCLRFLGMTAGAIGVLVRRIEPEGGLDAETLRRVSDAVERLGAELARLEPAEEGPL